MVPVHFGVYAHVCVCMCLRAQVIVLLFFSHTSIIVICARVTEFDEAISSDARGQMFFVYI